MTSRETRIFMNKKEAAQEQVVITGAGSGIGRELTKLFIESGSRVLAVSLLDTELRQLQKDLDPSGQQLRTLVMDLSRPEAAQQLFDHCASHQLVVDVLINNAGFACYGDVVEMDVAKFESMIGLNVLTMTKLSRLFGSAMKARGCGSMLNVGSTAGMLPACRFAAYSGSKAYVNAFSFALREELAPYGVNVSCLTPAAVATNFAAAADIDRFQGKSMLKDMFSKGKASSPVDVARAGFRGLRKGKAQILTGNNAWSVAVMFHLLPQARIPSLLKGL